MNEFDYSDNLPENEKENLLKMLRNSIEESYAGGKINEIHYNLLQKKLSSYEK